MAARGRFDRGEKALGQGRGSGGRPAGGRWTLEVRVTRKGKELAAGRVGQVGVGEVFVVAGQSNSANHLVLPKTRRFAMSGSPCSITLG